MLFATLHDLLRRPALMRRTAVALLVFVLGSAVSASEPVQLVDGETAKIAVDGSLTIAEISGRPAYVTASYRSIPLNGTVERKYDLAPLAQRLIDFSPGVGHVEATIAVSGEGTVVLSTQATTIQPANSAIVTSTFKAAPFHDPATGLVYVRNRWYDPGTGTFLSPDPLGYSDSANLYAFAGGDPVNMSDPLGTEAAHTAKGGVYIIDPASGERYHVSAKSVRDDTVALQDLLMIQGGLTKQEAKDFLQDMGLRYTHTYEHRVVKPALPSERKWVTAAFIAATGLPPQTREQEILSGGVQIASTLATAFRWPYALKNSVTARPDRGVGVYEYDTFGNLKARSIPRDGLDIDHQPSNASNLARAEAELGRPLTPAEIEMITAEGMAVAVPVERHRAKSPTYGGRNRPEQIKRDAADAAAAAARDTQAMIEGAAPAKRRSAKQAANAVRKRAGGK